MHACEWASEQASVQVERFQEGERNRTEKETEETQREWERQRGGGFVQWQTVQEQVAILQEKGGASFNFLRGDLSLLQISFSLTEDSPACGVRLSPLL